MRFIAGFILFSLIFVVHAGSSRELQFENDKVKVWKTTILPQGDLQKHRHDHDRIVVGLKGGQVTCIDQKGKRKNIDIQSGKAYWFDKDPKDTLNSDVNETQDRIEVMVIEIKS